MSEYQNFKLETDQNNIVWLWVDRANASANSLSKDVFSELDEIIDALTKKSKNIKGVIIASAKKKGFIAGADISQFVHLKTTKEAFELIRQPQIILDKLEALSTKIPTVAMIDGFCLGGGLELALACRYRVAANTAETMIGLPEVKLGIHPGWGGTVRLPKLIGALQAMQMILPGAAYPAKKCFKLGIVDAAVPVRMLKRAAIDFILKKPKKHKPNFLSNLYNLFFIRKVLGKLLIQNLRAKKVNPEHYPAPYAVVNNWVKDGTNNNAMINEAKSISSLMLGETARNLVRIFFLQEKLKGIGKQGGGFKPTWVRVIGAGTMGGDIAAWCAFKGMRVTLQDQSPEKIAPAIARAAKLFSEKLREPRLIQAALDRLQPDIKGDGIAHADVIIEAVFENLSVKQGIFSLLEAKAKPDAILATNTSSIPLEEIGTVLKNPGRLVGIHFFNPVSKMPLVEVVYGKNTSDETVHRTAAFVGLISRSPLPVASSPGFLVNRVLMPYLMEAMLLFEEGNSPATIDQVAVDFGMPMGPIALADKVGLDVCLSVAENLMQYFGGEVPERLKSMVKAGKLGVKSGQGFYTYKNGKPIKSGKPEKWDATSKAADMSDRMILRMLNEAVACLFEGVVSEADLVDAGMIFGTGFAPFRGGPLQYAKTRGVNVVIARLESLTRKYGKRFEPQDGWKNLTLNDNSSFMDEVGFATTQASKQGSSSHESISN